MDTPGWGAKAAMSCLEDKWRGEGLKEYSKLITLGGRVETMEDLACIVSYLVSSDADYMTGQ
jgi:hypothetical protein